MVAEDVLYWSSTTSTANSRVNSHRPPCASCTRRPEPISQPQLSKTRWQSSIHKLYWAATNSLDEATTCVQSSTARPCEAVWKSINRKGNGVRATLTSTCSTFRSHDSKRTMSSTVGSLPRLRVAERIANEIHVEEGEYFTRTRRNVRSALLEHGIAGRIEELATNLLMEPDQNRPQWGPVR